MFKTLQAEDEIAGICTSIGAAFAGNLAVTTTSGPGLSLKSEAIGLAVMTELPLVIVDVQRGGPSTGLPTKTEQSDLMQALWGRNGECPLVVIAASTPSDCFNYAFQSAKIALETHDAGYVINGWFYCQRLAAVARSVHDRFPRNTCANCSRRNRGLFALCP